jgi:hypothetical protein
LIEKSPTLSVHFGVKVMTKAGMIVGSVAIVLVGAIAVTLANSTFRLGRVPMDERSTVERTQTPLVSTAPFQKPEFTQSDGIDPLTASAPPAPNDSTSAAKTATLDQTVSVPSAQAGSPVGGAEVLVPDAEQRRTALSSAEKAAIARGLKELELTAVVTAEFNLNDRVAEEARTEQ